MGRFYFICERFIDSFQKWKNTISIYLDFKVYKDFKDRI